MSKWHIIGKDESEPPEPGWYMIYAPFYEGLKSKTMNGIMISSYRINTRGWGIGPQYIKAWRELPKKPKWNKIGLENLPKKAGWYIVKAPSYQGIASKATDGTMLSDYSPLSHRWNIESKRKGCVKGWRELPNIPKIPYYLLFSTPDDDEEDQD